MEQTKTCPECLRERPISMFMVTTTEVRTCCRCWGTPSENMFDSYLSRHGGQPEYGSDCGTTEHVFSQP